MTLRAVDCQGFAGGFTLGMVQAGFQLVGKREERGGFGLRNLEVNRHLLPGPWEAETRDPGSWTPVEAEVVFGNPPCGGFSIRSNDRGAHRPSNVCMTHFVEYAARCRPLVAVFESVSGARTMPDGLEFMRELWHRLEQETGLAYDLYHVRHSAHTLGGAGLRKRYFWVASRVPFGVEHRTAAMVPTLRDVVGDLADLPVSWSSQAYQSPATWWSQDKRSPAGTVDGHAVETVPKTQRLADLLAGPFTWAQGEYLEDFVQRYAAAGLELPDSVRGTYIGYGKMVRWEDDEPCRVVVRDTSTIAIHPTLDRFLTIREVARIMGFPDDWLIEPLKGTPHMPETWGKGVTVQCGRWIGHWIRQALEGNPGGHRGVSLGDREQDIDVTYGLTSEDD